MTSLNYPTVLLRVKSGNLGQDIEVSTSFFNEVISELSKNKIPFNINVHSGSFDFSIQILLDLLNQISTNPGTSLVLTGAVTGAVGMITQKILDHRYKFKSIKQNKAWKFFAKLKLDTNKNLDKKLDSITVEGRSIRVGFKGKNGEIVYESYRSFADNVVDDSLPHEDDLNTAIIRNMDKLKTQDLVLLALSLNNEGTATEIRDILASWGKPSGQWFYASGVLSRLVRNGLIQKFSESSDKRRVSHYRLTKRGRLESDKMIASLMNVSSKQKLPFILQRIEDRRVRKIRLFYVSRNIERCMILFNSTPLIWDGGERTEKTIGKGGGGNVVIPDSIFKEDGIVTVRYDGETVSRRYKDLVEAEP
jgi:DNA-binding PadR family transcriptional regulator